MDTPSDFYLHSTLATDVWLRRAMTNQSYPRGDLVNFDLSPHQNVISRLVQRVNGARKGVGIHQGLFIEFLALSGAARDRQGTRGGKRGQVGNVAHAQNAWNQKSHARAGRI